MGKCLFCCETIKKPVCPACVEEQIKEWLKTKDKTLIKRFPKFYEENTNGVKCVLCGRSIDVCTNCYVEDVRFWLNGINPVLTEEFLSCFNFDLRYTQPNQLNHQFVIA